MTKPDAIVIVGAARTPMGGFLGDLKDVSAPALGARAIEAALERAGLKPDAVDEVVMGCVLPAGQGQAPGAAGLARRGRAARRRRDDHQQDVRLGHEGGDVRA